MAARHFLDTNVLVYAFGSDARKRAVAQALIEEALQTRTGVISAARAPPLDANPGGTAHEPSALR